ncbi:gas vesicle protein GvpG [Nodularia spumigena CS-590/01]|nr:gas vesicle protein GvpG [Nodularia spumigena CS-590/01]
MTMLMKLLLSPIMGPINGVVWIAEKIEERANTEFDDQENLNKQLLTLQLSLDMGDITEEEYDAQEEEILLKLQELEEEARLEAESEEYEALEEQTQVRAYT